MCRCVGCGVLWRCMVLLNKHIRLGSISEGLLHGNHYANILISPNGVMKRFGW